MPTTLELEAVEQSAYFITATFTDEDGAAVTPNAGLKWTLTDLDGKVVNSKQDEPLTPDTSVTILLSGDDLAILESALNDYRILTIEGTYDSALQSDLPFKDQARFRIFDLDYVS